MKHYKLFISHSWKYDEDYKNLVQLLNNAKYFEYSDYSVPSDDPLTIYNPQTNTELLNKLTNQISQSEAFIVIGGLYAKQSETINEEIAIAQLFDKPIIVVKPFGNERCIRIEDYEKSYYINWSTDSIVEAIRNYAI